MQDGGHLLGRAHSEARDCCEGAVSGLFSLRGSGPSRGRGGGGSGPAGRGGPSAPAPSVAALLIGPAAAAAAATGPTVQPSTGCRHRCPGGLGESGGAEASGSCERPRECSAEGSRPPGLGGVPVVAPSPEKTGLWVPLLRDLSAALELGRLNFSGEVTCSDSARVFLAEAETQP